MEHRWKIGTTNSVIIPGLRDIDQDRVNPLQKTYIASGPTITGNLLNSDGGIVAAFDSFTYIDGTRGDWRGDVDIPDDGTVSVGDILTAKVVSAAPYSRTWQLTGRAVYGP